MVDDLAADFDHEWDELDPAFCEALARTWESLSNRGLPVGSSISRGKTIVSSGRNRVYDERGGVDPLQRTQLAHAEMNAIASAPDGIELDACELWSTQQPCSMCQGAIDFVGIRRVNFLASDPSSLPEGSVFVSSGHSDELWIVVANTLFLHNVEAVGGPDNPMLTRVRATEPEIVSLTLELIADRTLTDAVRCGANIDQALSTTWTRYQEASRERLKRLRSR